MLTINKLNKDPDTDIVTLWYKSGLSDVINTFIRYKSLKRCIQTTPGINIIAPLWTPCHVVMLPKLKISAYVTKVGGSSYPHTHSNYSRSEQLQRLAKLKNPQNSGCIYGLMYQGNILILGFNLEGTDADGVAMNYKTIQNQFPEIDLIGLIKFGSCSDAAAHLSEIISDVDVTDNPVLLTCDSGCENLKGFFFKNGKLEETEYEVLSEEELYKSFSFVRLRFDLREYVDDLSRIPEIMQQRRKYVSYPNTMPSISFPH